MEVLSPHCKNAIAPLPPDERGAARHTKGWERSSSIKPVHREVRSRRFRGVCINKGEKLQSQETNSVETLLHTRDLEPQSLEKTSGAPLWFSTLVIGQKQNIFFFFSPKWQIIANPLLHITYHLSPHQWLLEFDGIKHSSQAVFVKSNNYIVTRIYN